MTNKEKTIRLLKNSLRSCYSKYGILAGKHHFTDYWARDGYFAALGSLELGDFEIVNKMVNLFFSFQREDGLIPYRIMNGPISLSKYSGKPTFYKKPKPTHKLRGFGKEVLDGSTLTIIFTALLELKEIHTKTPTTKIEKTLNYLLARERHGLLC